MNNKIINIIAVAQFQKSHGYERIIQGLYQYNLALDNNKPRIILHMVGDGLELRYYKRLVREMKLDSEVIFYGRLSGKELDAVYDYAHIGIGCFGLYKRKINYISALKTGEYLLKGLPVITGCREAIFEKNHVPFYLEFSNDSSIIPMETIVDFYDDLLAKYSADGLKKMIVEYGKKNCDINVTMMPIISYIEKESDER